MTTPTTPCADILWQDIPLTDYRRMKDTALKIRRLSDGRSSWVYQLAIQNPTTPCQACEKLREAAMDVMIPLAAWKLNDEQEQYREIGPTMRATLIAAHDKLLAALFLPCSCGIPEPPEVISEAAKQAADPFLKWCEFHNISINKNEVQKFFARAIDQVCAERDANIAQMVQDMMKDGEHIAGLVKQLAERDEELHQLRQWKKEQMQIESTWDEQKVGHLLGMELGTPIRENILPAIQALSRDKARLDWLEEQRKGGRYEVFPSPHGLSLVSFRHHDEKGFPTAREAIDAARLT